MDPWIVAIVGGAVATVVGSIIWALLQGPTEHSMARTRAGVLRLGRRLVGHLAAQRRAETDNFLMAIGYSSEIAHETSAYRRLPELFVPPQEYDKMKEILDEHHILFIVGDPQIGKTYAALRLLHENYSEGYQPYWLRVYAETRYFHIDELSGKLDGRNKIYLEDPWGKTRPNYQEDLTSRLWVLMATMRHKQAKLIISSRTDIFHRILEYMGGRADISRLTVVLDMKNAYSEEARRKIVENYIRIVEPIWAQDERVKEEMVRELSDLDPLAIHSVVTNTRESLDIRELMEKSRQGVAHEFSFEIRRYLDRTEGKPWRIPFLLLVHVLKDIPKERLAEVYVSLVNTHLPTDPMMVPETLQDCVNSLRHRVVTYKNWEGNNCLEFYHPTYDEAVSLSLDDRLIEEWFGRVVEKLSLSEGDAWAYRLRKRSAIAVCDDIASIENEQAQMNLVQVLERLSQDPDHRVREIIPYGLCRGYGGFSETARSVVQTILEKLAADENKAVRQRVAHEIRINLDTLPAELVAKVMRRLSEDDDAEVRQSSIQLLVSAIPVFRHPLAPADEPFELLEPLTHDTSEKVRGNLAYALFANYGTFSERETILATQLLRTLAGDDDPHVLARLLDGIRHNLGKFEQQTEKLEVAVELMNSICASRFSDVKGALPYVVCDHFERLPADLGQELLTTLSEDSEVRVRRIVVNAICDNLGSLPENLATILLKTLSQDVPSIRSRLICALRDGFREMPREAAEIVLGSLGASGGLEFSDEVGPSVKVDLSMISRLEEFFEPLDDGGEVWKESMRALAATRWPNDLIPVTWYNQRIQIIKSAVVGSRPVKMTYYTGHRDSTTERIFYPHEFSEDRRWVAGYDGYRQEDRKFKISRILSVEMTEP